MLHRCGFVRAFPSNVIGWIAIAAISGCGSSGIPLGTVSGHVTKNGQPQQGIAVHFEPIAGGRGSQGSTDATGFYELYFAGGRKGAVLGRHQVSVEAKARYNDADIVVRPAQKFLTVEREVQSGSNEYSFDIANVAEK